MRKFDLQINPMYVRKTFFSKEKNLPSTFSKENNLQSIFLISFFVHVSLWTFFLQKKHIIYFMHACLLVGVRCVNDLLIAQMLIN